MNDTKQNEIISEFEMFDDWMDRYSYLIDLSGELPEISPEHRTQNYKISGCQSSVWIDASLDESGLMHFTADSDAIITKGIISLLIRVLDGRTPEDVLNTELYFIDKIGLSANLSPARANGLVAMIRQMRMYATAFLAQKA